MAPKVSSDQMHSPPTARKRNPKGFWYIYIYIYICAMCVCVCVCVACTHSGTTNMSMLLVADAAVAAHLERKTKLSNEAAAKEAGHHKYC